MPIARLYETEQQAQDAAAKLSGQYPDATVYLLTPSSGEDAAAALRSGGFDAGDAAAFASEIAQGRSLVVNNASFGQGVTVKAILDEFAPVPMAGPLPSASTKSNGRYTPFSDLLGWRPLTDRHQQAWWWGDLLKRPGVTSLGAPRLKRYDITSLGTPRLKQPGVTSLGIPRLLKNNPTPLSSLLGLPLSKPYDVASFGQPRLKKPDVTSLGFPRLLKNR